MENIVKNIMGQGTNADRILENITHRKHKGHKGHCARGYSEEKEEE